ncbi:hypothetical protein BaRGS_00013499 [Batillaria attramentaria]|uniref:Uncharacterized protein n=1 Tax=Batillaria attramentaria TaxID=370345 RepID=A0ABD0L770_9CAEN
MNLYTPSSQNTWLFQVAAALSVDALEAFRRALDEMVGRRHDVFHSTFRRGVVYNLNRTLGVPCNTRPVLPWMHGTEIFYSLKRVRTFVGVV